MINAGIFPDDILVVDRALNAVNNSIVIAVVNGEFTVKRIQFHLGKISLLPENPAYSPIYIDHENFEVWGVVTYVIHKAK
jgi:DNA polymerase V